MLKTRPVPSSRNCLRQSVHNDWMIVSNCCVECDFPTADSGRKFRVSDRPMDLHTERDRNVGIVYHLSLPCGLFTLEKERCLSGEHQPERLVRQDRNV